MKRWDWIVLCICILCLYAVVQIRLGWFWNINSVENSDAINSIIEGLSYSYIAAYLFYILTTFLPTQRRKEMLNPIIRDRVKKIGTKNVHNILLEFGRGTKLGTGYRDTEHTVEILKSKNWDDIVPMLKKYNGKSISYLHYVNLNCKEMKNRVADIIIRYKEVLTEEELVVLEDFSEMPFFNWVESLSSFPNIKVNDGVSSLIDDFVKMQNKYLEVERLFGIEAKD